MEATWIKVKDDRTKPLLIHLSGSEMPSYIDLPGEQEKTRVYEYRERPKVCRKCLEYGHRTKFCEKETKCRLCCQTSHMAVKCLQQTARCYHCEGEHQTGSRICSGIVVLIVSTLFVLILR